MKKLSGIYTVKSRYKIGMTFIKNPTPTKGPSKSHHDSKLWYCIHIARYNPKIRCFFGKLCLFFQILFYCAFAGEVWAQLPLGWKRTQHSALSFRDLMHSISIQYSTHYVTIFVTCAWLIWFTRNRFQHEGSTMKESMIALQASYFSQMNFLHFKWFLLLHWWHLLFMHLSRYPSPLPLPPTLIPPFLPPPLPSPPIMEATWSWDS